MPRVDIINETNVPLHIALKQISPLHFVNYVPPNGGRATFERVGRVWFTVEARIARQAASSDEAHQTTEKDEQRQIEGTDASASTATADSSSSESGSKRTAMVNATKAKAKEWQSSMQGKVAQLRGSADPNSINNEYTMFQSVAAPVAVSVAALSLGAGAVYIGLTASAAGGISAALSSTSAELSAAAMSSGATAHRFLSFAKKGQSVAQIGRVLGIGGSALGGSWLGKRDAGNKKGEASSGNGKQVTSTASSGTAVSNANSFLQKDMFDHLTDKDNIDRVKAVTRVLKRLVCKPVVSSHGWYMGEDRTIIIRGGPQAAEVEQYLIIETDTVEPFEVVGKRVEGDRDSKEADSSEQEQLRANAEADAGSGTNTPNSVTQTQDDQGRLVEKHDPLAKLRKEEAKEREKAAKKEK